MFTLDQVVPWGRSFDEYTRMFALTPADLQQRILGCGDGPASFNAEGNVRGVRIVSCDPLYRWNPDQIRGRIEATAGQVLDQTARTAHEFRWDVIRSVDELRTVRLAAMDRFLEDYRRGAREGRYVAAQLPELPFASASFDVAVCSHFLFLYTAHLTEAFHVESVRALCRAARDVRIFPLLALGGALSAHLDATLEALRSSGHEVAIERVPYEFQRGGNQMLRVTPATGPSRRLPTP